MWREPTLQPRRRTRRDGDGESAGGIARATELVPRRLAIGLLLAALVVVGALALAPADVAAQPAEAESAAQTDGDEPPEIGLEDVQYPGTVQPGSSFDVVVRMGNGEEAVWTENVTVEAGNASCAPERQSVNLSPRTVTWASVTCQAPADAAGSTLSPTVSTSAGTETATIDVAAGPGSVDWSYATGDGTTAPTIVDGTAYVGDGDRQLHAVDVATGEEQWNATLSGGVATAPHVADGTVFVGTDWANGTVAAVDAETGAVAWERELEEQTWNPRVWSSPTYADGTVYVGSHDSRLYALDADTGEREWTVDAFTDWVTASPVVYEGTVYVGDMDGNVYAVDAETGDVEWNATKSAQVWSGATVVEDTVYLPAEDPDAVFALDADTGEERWNASVGSAVYTAPTVANGTVYVGSHDFSAYAFDAETGEQRWQYGTGNGVTSSVTVADGAAFFGSEDGSLYAVDAASGEGQWSLELGGGVGSPTVANGTVYAPSEDALLHAVDAGVEGSSEGSRVVQGLEGHVGDRGDASDASIAVESVEHADPTEAGTTVDVDVTLANEGEATGSDLLRVDAARIDCSPAEAPVTLAPGASTTVAVECWVPEERADSTQPIDLWTGDDVTSTTIRVEADAGRTEWTLETGDAVTASPSVVETEAGPTAFVGSHDGRVYAADAATGEERWNRSIGDSAGASPVVADVSAGAGNSSADSGGGTVYAVTLESLVALDADDGTIHWSATPNTSTAGAANVSSAPTFADVSGGTVYVGASDGALDAFDAATGEHRWRVSVADRVWTSPAVVDGTVYFGARNGTVHAADARTGDLRWNASVDGNVEFAATVVDQPVAEAHDSGTVYVQDDTDTLYALDAESGERRWSRTESGLAAGSVATPTVVGVGDDATGASENGTVYGVGGGKVVAYDAATGAQQWLFPTGDWLFSSPTVAGDTVYVGGGSDGLYAIDAAEGTERWNVSTDGHVDSSPTVADGTVYVGGSNGSLYAVDADGAATSEGTRVRQAVLGHVGALPANGSEPAPTCVAVGDLEPCDLDGDGDYYDVNGDGSVGQADVAAFFQRQHRDAWKQPDLFDFTGNDRVTHGDVVALFDYVALN